LTPPKFPVIFELLNKYSNIKGGAMKKEHDTPVFDHKGVDTASMHLLPYGEVERLGEFFKVLTDPTRLEILYALEPGELCVFDLSAAIGAAVSSVSHHLASLKRGRLVKARRDGRIIFYSLDDDHVKSILEYARDHLAEKG
jgi:DNA-binding transcriptional ArsR family regulator